VHARVTSSHTLGLGCTMHPAVHYLSMNISVFQAKDGDTTGKGAGERYNNVHKDTTMAWQVIGYASTAKKRLSREFI
jgi:hypothetical protein